MTITPAEEAVARALAKSSNETQWENYLPAARAAIIAHLEAILLPSDDAVLEACRIHGLCFPDVVNGCTAVNNHMLTAIIDHMLAEVTS
jgi:hypothetical protein